MSILTLFVKNFFSGKIIFQKKIAVKKRPRRPSSKNGKGGGKAKTIGTFEHTNSDAKRKKSPSKTQNKRTKTAEETF